MPVLNITKRYNNKSPLCGIIITDKVVLPSRDGLTNFLLGCSKAHRYGSLDWEILDYSWALSDKDTREILENPTGGKIGKLT